MRKRRRFGIGALAVVAGAGMAVAGCSGHPPSTAKPLPAGVKNSGEMMKKFYSDPSKHGIISGGDPGATGGPPGPGGMPAPARMPSPGGR